MAAYESSIRRIQHDIDTILSSPSERPAYVSKGLRAYHGKVFSEDTSFSWVRSKGHVRPHTAHPSSSSISSRATSDRFPRPLPRSVRGSVTDRPSTAHTRAWSPTGSTAGSRAGSPLLIRVPRSPIADFGGSTSKRTVKSPIEGAYSDSIYSQLRAKTPPPALRRRDSRLEDMRRNSFILAPRTPMKNPEAQNPARRKLTDDQKAKLKISLGQSPRKAICYNLPHQLSLVVSDQSAQAARDGVVLVAFQARQDREREKVRQRLLELIWADGAILVTKKEEARKALETGDVDSALRLIHEAETLLKQSEIQQALESPVAWKKTRVARNSISTQPHTYAAQGKDLAHGEFVVAAAAGAGHDEAEQPEPDESTDEITGGKAKDAVPEEAKPEPGARSSPVEREERLKRLQAMMIPPEKRQKATTSTPSDSLQSEQISLPSRKLQEIPDVLLEEGTGVKMINLRVNDIPSIPDKFCMKLLNLEEIDLGFNKLPALPPTLGCLVNLRRLYVNENRLLALPSSIGCLKKLDSLNIDKNQLCKLPPTMAKLTSLWKLSLKLNKTFTLPPQDVVDKGPAAIRGFLSKVLDEGLASRSVLWDELDQRQMTVPALFLALGEKGAHRIDWHTFEERMRWDLRFKIPRKHLVRLWHLLDEAGGGYVSNREFLYLLKRPVLLNTVHH